MDNSIMISAHSILRWAVLLFGFYTITKSARGIVYKQEYTSNHNLAATLFTASVHLQVVIGLLLYVARGWAGSLSKMDATLGNATSRFWAVEHLVGMLLAAIVIQIGRNKSKKATELAEKHKISIIFFSLGLLIILAMIPWPFKGAVARSLWP